MPIASSISVKASPDWTQSYECFGQRRCRVDDVFTIVKNQQKLLFGDGPCDGLGRYNAGCKSEPESPGHRGRDEIGVG